MYESSAHKTNYQNRDSVIQLTHFIHIYEPRREKLHFARCVSYLMISSLSRIEKSTVYESSAYKTNYQNRDSVIQLTHLIHIR